nr:unnamed protein product [Callosobruchus analis]
MVKAINFCRTSEQSKHQSLRFQEQQFEVNYTERKKKNFNQSRQGKKKKKKEKPSNVGDARRYIVQENFQRLEKSVENVDWKITLLSRVGITIITQRETSCDYKNVRMDENKDLCDSLKMSRNSYEAPGVFNFRLGNPFCMRSSVISVARPLMTNY